MADPWGQFKDASQGDPWAQFKDAAPDVGAVPAALEGAAQGLTFGFSDELEGLARAGYGALTGDGKKTFGQLYDEAVAKPRYRIKAAKASNPLAYYGGEITSALAVPGGLSRLGVRGAIGAAAHRGLGARMAAGAAEGAAYGGAYGLGQSESQANDIGGVLKDRVLSAAQGAALGGAIGGVAAPAVDVAGAVASRVAAPFRAVMNPRQFAAEKMGEAIARDASTATDNLQTGLEAARFANKYQTMADVNPRAVVMDAGGENVRNLMRAAQNVPSQARERVRKMVDQRQAFQWKRIEDSLVHNMDESRNFYQSVDDLTRQMDEIGSQQIRPALQIETPITPRLANVLDRPTTRELRSLVERKIQDEGRPVGFETRTEMLHRMKMELDDQIGVAMRAERMGNKPQAGWDARTLTTLRRDLMNAIDNPQYKEGLRNYAGQARLQNAAEDGYDAFRTSQPEQIRATLRGFETEGERQMYRMGAMRSVVEQIRTSNVTRDRTDGMFSSPAIQMRLRAIFPSNRQFREFQKALVVEAKMADSRKALQGNSTTAKQLAEGQAAGQMARGVSWAMNAASGRLEPILNLLAQGHNWATGLNPAVSNRLLELGASRNPAAISALAERGIDRAAMVPAQRAQAARALAAGGASTAAPANPLEVTVYPPGDPRNYR